MNTLKSLAQKAKNRLKSVGLNVSSTSTATLAESVIKKCAVSYKQATFEKELEDDKLFPKVKNMLENNPDTPYPLRELIDQKTYDKLSSIDKEKYILGLAKRYQMLREKYLKEHKNL